jgi:NADPH2:quinone reductase
MAVETFGGVEQLQAVELPRPRPQRGEILIRTVAAGVNPMDAHLREGKMPFGLAHRLPVIPGWDVAGVVEELGEGAMEFRKGDRVWAFARKPLVQWGCYAEYVSLPESSVAMMPTRLLFEEAAGVPMAALAAWQALFSRGDLGTGKSVLVHAGAGGVGHFAVQFAQQAGARVLATAGAANQSFLLSLGAEVGIDYTREDFREAVRRAAPQGVDLVLDSVGGETLARSLELVRDGGRIVGLVDTPDAARCAARQITADGLAVEPVAETLRELARRFDAKKLRVNVQKIYLLAQAGEAHRVVEGGHVRGKLVLNL